MHAHAVFEQRAGQPDAARRLFARAAELDPGNEAAAAGAKDAAMSLQIYED